MTSDREMDDFAYHENSPLGFTKMAKSNDMVFSKIDFLIVRFFNQYSSENA